MHSLRKVYLFRFLSSLCNYFKCEESNVLSKYCMWRRGSSLGQVALLELEIFAALSQKSAGILKRQ